VPFAVRAFCRSCAVATWKTVWAEAVAAIAATASVASIRLGLVKFMVLSRISDFDFFGFRSRNHANRLITRAALLHR
jgi:hypothetical protein